MSNTTSRDRAIAAAAAAGVASAAVLGVLFTRQVVNGRRAADKLRQLQAALAHEQEKRAADRAGRIRAEQQLKELRLQLAVGNLQQSTPSQQHRSDTNQQHGDIAVAAAAAVASQAAGNASSSSSSSTGKAVGDSSMSVFPFTAIGTLRSCFTSRTGTPRQPHLVPAARSVLRLGPGIPPTCLEGLQSFSHCWLLYTFHANTDIAKVLAARANIGGGATSAHVAGVKSHVKVPRLNGAKLGVLATRTPHRPVPIGLSTAQIIDVDAAAGVLVLGGVDVVDGTPILDVKPYVPFSDALPYATTPDWVTAEASQDPLALGEVVISDAAQQQLTAAWQAVQKKSLYQTAQQFIELVQQVLARDIRSLHQRTNVLPVQQSARQQQGAADSETAAAGEHVPSSSSRESSNSHCSGEGRYKVGLDGICVSYDVCSQTGRIHIRNACVT